MSGELEGKTAIVTGGASGIGAAVARALAAEGAAVAIVDIDHDGALGHARELEELGGGPAFALRADLARPEDAERVVAEVLERRSRLDVLVNSAGLFRLCAFEDLPLEEWRALLEVNLTAPMLLSQHAVRHMLERGSGSIVNITSIAGDLGAATSVAYCASKGGLQMLTRSMAVEYASRGVRVNAVAPHAIDTPMTAGIKGTEMGERVRAGIPMERFGRVEEVAEAVVFLASDRSSFVTGVTLAVNGGTSVRLPA